MVSFKVKICLSKVKQSISVPLQLLLHFVKLNKISLFIATQVFLSQNIIKQYKAFSDR